MVENSGPLVESSNSGANCPHRCGVAKTAAPTQDPAATGRLQDVRATHGSLILVGPGLGTSADLHPPVVLELPAELFQALCHPWGPFLLWRQRSQGARRGKSGSLVSA